MTTFTRALLITALSAPLAASAQEAPKDTTNSDATSKASKSSATDTSKEAVEKLSPNELQILAHYHNDNQKEIELGRLASKRGSTQDVRAFGEMMVKDHGDLEKQLASVAKKTGQMIPKEKQDAETKKAEAESAKQRADLMKLKGTSFDQEYLRMMVQEHQRTLADLDAHIAEAKHPELVSTLQGARPILQRHLDRAQELQKKESQAKK